MHQNLCGSLPEGRLLRRTIAPMHYQAEDKSESKVKEKT
jgi:hypothetical protein